MSTSVKKLLKNILANQMGFLVSVVVTFFLSPFVVHSLGDVRYGVWALIVSLTGNYGLLTFGIQGAMTRYIAHAAATDDRERVNEYFNSAMLFLLSSATLVIVIGLCVALLIEHIFVLPVDLIREAKWACILVTFSVAGAFGFTAFDCILIAHQRFQITNTLGILMTLVRAAITIYLLKNGYDIIALAALSTGLSILNGTILITAIKRFYPWIELSLQCIKPNRIKELINYGYKSFIIAISISLIYQFDLIVIGIYFSPAKIATYSFASTLITYLTQFVSSISRTFGPYATELYAKGQNEELRKLFINASRSMYILGGLIVAGCITYGKDFYTLWLGPNYAESAVILSILVIPHFFSTGAKVGSSLLTSMAMIGPLAISTICEGLFNLILSIVLVKHYGLIGVAIGTLVPNVINNGLWLPLYIFRTLNMQLKIYFSSIMPGIMIGTVLYFIGYFLRNILIPETWTIFTLNITIVILFFIICISLLYPLTRYLFSRFQILILKI